jgi:catechol 2,3-dioxygenase-like lactoylglutathione lyase family enzyme
VEKSRGKLLRSYPLLAARLLSYRSLKDYFKSIAVYCHMLRACHHTKGRRNMDWKLELVVVSVSDVDHAKAFYTEKAGFNEDHDHTVSDEFRVVQLTPPRLGLLDCLWDRDRRHAARLSPGPTLGRLGHKCRACGARRAGSEGRRAPGSRWRPVRSLQRFGQERLDLAAAALLAYSPNCREEGPSRKLRDVRM